MTMFVSSIPFWKPNSGHDHSQDTLFIKVSKQFAHFFLILTHPQWSGCYPEEYNTWIFVLDNLMISVILMNHSKIVNISFSQNFSCLHNDPSIHYSWKFTRYFINNLNPSMLLYLIRDLLVLGNARKSQDKNIVLSEGLMQVGAGHNNLLE